MTKIIGLTGGIGSGKSTVAKFLIDMGWPVYFSDDWAKHLMNESMDLKKSIVLLLGDVYHNNQLDRALVASKVFGHPELLERLNALVHPAVAKHFNQWVLEQSKALVFKESAILFETGAHQFCDKTILVTSPSQLRIERLLERDKTSIEGIQKRIDHQMSDDEKIKLADYVIQNDGTLEDLNRNIQALVNAMIKTIDGQL